LFNTVKKFDPDLSILEANMKVIDLLIQRFVPVAAFAGMFTENLRPTRLAKIVKRNKAQGDELQKLNQEMTTLNCEILYWSPGLWTAWLQGPPSHLK
jgi:hypothetical protein